MKGADEKLEGGQTQGKCHFWGEFAAPPLLLATDGVLGLVGGPQEGFPGASSFQPHPSAAAAWRALSRGCPTGRGRGGEMVGKAPGTEDPAKHRALGRGGLTSGEPPVHLPQLSSLPSA